MLLEFPAHRARRHQRASTSSREASCASSFSVTPLRLATVVAHTADHHSSGILSRRHHLPTVDASHDGPPPTPTSEAIALRLDQSSITSRKESGRFDMAGALGQFGLTRKANTAHDCERLASDISGAMADRMSETEEKAAFIARVRAAREARFDTQKPMLTILGVEQDVYKHYETRTPLPYRYIPKFCAATGVSYEWLLTGEGKGPAVEIAKHVPQRIRKPRGSRAA